MILNLIRNNFRFTSKTASDNRNFEIAAPNGAVHKIVTKEVLHTLSTGGTTSTITALFPDGCIVLGYSARVVAAITTGGDRTTVNFGESAGGTQFGTKSLSTQVLAAGTTLTFADPTSPVGGKNYAADQDFVIQVAGGTTGNISGGVLRVNVAYMQSVPPTA